jgi:hypothetical protein
MPTRGPRPPRPPSICHPRPPCPPWPPHPPCPPPNRPPDHWLIEHGYMLEPKRVGHPVRAELRFKPNPVDPRLPRLPWPNETESRAAGTGLLLSWWICPPPKPCHPKHPHEHGEG